MAKLDELLLADLRERAERAQATDDAYVIPPATLLVVLDRLEAAELVGELAKQEHEFEGYTDVPSGCAVCEAIVAWERLR
jgi:hypothetical protein